RLGRTPAAGTWPARPWSQEPLDGSVVDVAAGERPAELRDAPPRHPRLVEPGQPPLARALHLLVGRGRHPPPPPRPRPPLLEAGQLLEALVCPRVVVERQRLQPLELLDLLQPGVRHLRGPLAEHWAYEAWQFPLGQVEKVDGQIALQLGRMKCDRALPPLKP